jgi:hypothetical protein
LKLPGNLFGRFKVGKIMMTKILEKMILLRDINDILKVLVIDQKDFTSDDGEAIVRSDQVIRFEVAKRKVNITSSGRC